jgi:hypothetical protein
MKSSNVSTLAAISGCSTERLRGVEPDEVGAATAKIQSSMKTLDALITLGEMNGKVPGTISIGVVRILNV